MNKIAAPRNNKNADILTFLLAFLDSDDDIAEYDTSHYDNVYNGGTSLRHAIRTYGLDDRLFAFTREGIAYIAKR